MMLAREAQKGDRDQNRGKGKALQLSSAKQSCCDTHLFQKTCNGIDVIVCPGHLTQPLARNDEVFQSFLNQFRRQVQLLLRIQNRDRNEPVLIFVSCADDRQGEDDGDGDEGRQMEDNGGGRRLQRKFMTRRATGRRGEEEAGSAKRSS